MPCWLSILLFSILISLSELQLPKGFRRVLSCPTPKNLTAWKEASADLGCTDDLENEDPKELNDIYNCMPSNYLNETVAFCGGITAITEGNCPVLNYEHKATVPTGRSCSNFTNGCPIKQFFTREIYKRPECLSINTHLRCYYADPRCPKNQIRTTTAVNYFIDENEEGSLSTKDIVIIILSVVVSFCLALIILLVKCRRRMKDKLRWIRNKTPTEQDEERGVKEPMPIEENYQTNVKSTVRNASEVTESGRPMISEIKENDSLLNKGSNAIESRNDERGVEKERKHIEEADITDVKSTVGHASEVNESGGMVISEIKENDSLLNKGSNAIESRNDGVLWRKSEQTEDRNGVTSFKVTADIENQEEVEEEKQQNIEHKETENDMQKSTITYETANAKRGKLGVLATLSEDNLPKEVWKRQWPTSMSSFGEKADMEKIYEEKEQKEQITEQRKTVNDVQKSIAYFESEDDRNRRVGNSVMCLETHKNNPIILDPGIDEDLLDFNSFFYRMVQEIIKRGLVQDFSLLLHDTTEENIEPLQKRFMHWNEKYKFHSNLWRLQLLLKQCGANDLVEECTEFAKSCTMNLTYFDSPFIRDENRELIYIYTTMDISQKVFDDLKRLLACRLNLPQTEIKLLSVMKGSLIFVFSVPKDNVKKLRYEDMLSIWPLKVFKVETSAWIMEPGLMTSKCRLRLYVQAEPHRSRIQDRLQPFAMAIKREMMRNFHLKIYIHKITCMVWKQPNAQYPPTKSMTSIEDIPFLFEKEILENMEPGIVKEMLIKCFPGYRREIEDLFSPTNARKQTAKGILTFLKEKKGKSFKNTMNCVIDMYRSKETPTCEIGDSIDSPVDEEIDLLQNTEGLFDEIDSSIINETFEIIGDVPFDIVKKCNPRSGRKRKERAKTFYDFVNRNKDHFQIFKNILQSNND